VRAISGVVASMAFADPKSRQSLLESPSVVGLRASSARRGWSFQPAWSRSAQQECAHNIPSRLDQAG